MAKTVELPPATASSSKLASTAGTTTADPALTAAKAVSELYTFFHRGKVAYTFNDRTVQRYYCRACLNNEIKVICEAREQFGQGANAPVEVLRDIALGRIEWYIPNQTYLADHLRNDCRHLTREERSRVNALVQAISEAKSKSYQSGFDYGSLFEVVQHPKYAESIQNLEPGTASPGRIFAAHEATLLARAKRRLNDTRRKNKLVTEGPLAQAPAPYDSDDCDEAQRLESRTVDNGKPEDPIDTSKMFDVNTEENNDALNLPAEFPSSDLLKALQAHAGDMYARRGLMSTESRPKDEEGKRLPSMIQAMDGSALIALGILTQELTKAHIVRPHRPQPISDFYERSIDRTDTWTLYGYRKNADRDIISRILEKLPEGSTAGLVSVDARADPEEAESGSESGTRMEE